MDELYDLQSDPYEMNNLVRQRGARDSLQAAQRQLEQLLKQTR
jgi:hypothetical protein